MEVTVAVKCPECGSEMHRMVVTVTEGMFVDRQEYYVCPKCDYSLRVTPV